MDVLFKQKMLLIIRALYFCMEDNWSLLERKFQVTPAQQHILFLLSTNKSELTPTQISELGCWHISTVTRLLKPLKESGLVEVSVNKDRPRFKRVMLTDSGKKLIIQLMDEFKEMEQMPLQIGDLSEEELATFLEIGEKILGVHKGENFMNMLVQARVENYDYA
ncbi:hypothetical protein GCM10008967_38240 [Bacillus carboniphilus]|uniref:HTH marR-type domain-containing protein n=1 Tax=Bacillus carboniphilus TaxID=86663 RepID=A0ABP3GFF8_9BACI